LAVMGVSEKNINMITGLVRFAWLLTDGQLWSILIILAECSFASSSELMDLLVYRSVSYYWIRTLWSYWHIRVYKLQ
jgi:hypothetical protein